MTINLLLVEDQPAVREGLKMRFALEPDLKVVGEARDGIDALRCARALSPDVIVMDVEMPRMDGMAATEAMHLLAPKSAVILLTIHDNARARKSSRGWRGCAGGKTIRRCRTARGDSSSSDDERQIKNAP
jgi:DNA-binding NarL/FixJ family response regulator